MEQELPIYARDLSWLSFNHRVLQEAMDDRVPLIERLRFLAIYSSNLDEFYRVRVASQLAIAKLKKKNRSELDYKPNKLVKQIYKTVDAQQELFGHTFRKKIIPALKRKNIVLVDNKQLNEYGRKKARTYFKKQVAEHIQINTLTKGTSKQKAPFIENRKLYFAVSTVKGSDKNYYIVNIPSDQVGRFYTIPAVKGDSTTTIIMLDDVIRLSLDQLFGKKETVEHCYSIKLSRDAELYIEDEFSGDLVNKIKKNLNKRKTGAPTRFLFDQNMPVNFQDKLFDLLGLSGKNRIPGGKYHNFHDFFSFPAPDLPELYYPAQPGLKHPELDSKLSLFDQIAQKDRILHFPYQEYQYTLDLLKAAVDDKDVVAIKITLYRVAKDSQVAKELIRAVKKGKEVMAFSEVKARFDEESNITWGNKMAKAGVKVVYSKPGIKVHSKLCLVYRKEGNNITKYGYLATGNFNEKTAGIYCDHALLTCNKDLTNEVDKVFSYLDDKVKKPGFKHLLVAPFNLRSGFEELIEREIKHVKKGLKGAITIKLNSLEDRSMIEKLYEAADAGVKIRIIVRGICCLVPRKNIAITSIVDRYLEHARIYVFHNAGKPEMFLASADWMKRNLSRRVEVAFPVVDSEVYNELNKILQFQLTDNTRARKIDKAQQNDYVSTKSAVKRRAQLDTYNYLVNKLEVKSALKKEAKLKVK